MIDKGYNYDFWCSGHMVYAGTVIVANFSLLKLFNEYHIIGSILVFLSIFMFWIILGILSLFPFSTVLYKIFI